MGSFIKPLLDEQKDVFFIEGRSNGRYPYANSFFIGDYIIDTGISSNLMRKLKKQFSINNVLLSHWHEDHIHGNRLLPDANYYCHLKDKHVIEDITNIYSYYGYLEEPDLVEELTIFLEGYRLTNTKIKGTIENNEIINIGRDFQLKVIHTPGHTKGHCCFYELNSKIGFFSDIDLSSFGPWYGASDSNVMDFEESINKMKQLDIEIAITSHKGIILGKKNIQEKVNNYLEVIFKRDERILSNLSESKPKSASDLMRKNLIYRKYGMFKIYEIFAEKMMIQLHFDKFIKKKIITPKEEGFVLL